jgi:hypothetical protein
VVTAVILVIVAFVGNVQLNVDSFYTFIKYLIPSLLFVGIMLGRSFDPMIDALEYFTNQCVKWCFSNRYLMKMNLKINSQSLCFHQRR